MRPLDLQFVKAILLYSFEPRVMTTAGLDFSAWSYILHLEDLQCSLAMLAGPGGCRTAVDPAGVRTAVGPAG